MMKEPSGMHMSMSTSGKGSFEFRFKVVESIEETDVPASAFEVPDGYEAVEDFASLMGRMSP